MEALEVDEVAENEEDVEARELAVDDLDNDWVGRGGLEAGYTVLAEQLPEAP